MFRYQVSRRAMTLLLGVAILASLSSESRAQGIGGDIAFPQTGANLSSAHGFLDYWQQHGGLAQFGYPLGPEAMEVSPADGRLYLTQWFERNRFEYHPENADPAYHVLLSLLGRDLAAGRQAEAPFRATQAGTQNPGCLFFPQTGHSICRTFRQYWEEHGGLPLYGYPLSEEFQERNPTDGKSYTVQYFERNRFELHPENVGSPYRVLLGLLGTQLGGFPVPPLPQANVPSMLQVPDGLKQGKWNEQHTLTGPAGMKISLFGTGPALRMMAVASNGDLFVSSRLDGKVFVMPDRNKDGVADETHIFAEGLPKPHGLAFYGEYLYVACEAEVLRFRYSPGQLEEDQPRQKVVDLPHGLGQGLVEGVGHDTRSIVFRQDKMFVSVGSSCDLCEDDPGRATIMQFNPDGSGGRIYARGLRNAVGLDVDPRTNLLWASVNERNTLGPDAPPDLLTTVRGGADYGWPYCVGIPPQPDPSFNKDGGFCAARESPTLGLPAHIAPLGIRFYNGGGQFPAAYDYGIFVATHGSAMAQGSSPAMRTPAYGYDVRFVSLRPGKSAQPAQQTISGWLQGGSYWGRPVDVAFGNDGAMYISDDAAGAVYRVTFEQR